MHYKCSLDVIKVFFCTCFFFRFWLAQTSFLICTDNGEEERKEREREGLNMFISLLKFFFFFFFFCVLWSRKEKKDTPEILCT